VAATGAELARTHAARLAASGIDSPEADARWLASAVLGVAVGALHTVRVSDEQAARLDALVERRAQRVPLQHLIGSTGFLGLDIACRPGVFVPRPETEVLAIEAVAAARRHAPAPRVLEPCTGTGAVTAALATAVSGADIHAGDRSTAAVALAEVNLAAVRRRPGWADGVSVTFGCGDLFDAFAPDLRGAVDVVVCNPPYLSQVEFDACPPEVRDHDPVDALVGGPVGNEVVDRVLRDARTWLCPGGEILVEVSEHRAAAAAELAATLGYLDVAVVHDLAGRPRVVRAAWGGDAP
ncbi:MAG TPA: HemK/PrmC family methyltransferase, partial [Solirubrobacteraceae bacterium]|nr:HemK/PrmC family methyltransferase [Solirubrobacteraceae bacterium]